MKSDFLIPCSSGACGKAGARCWCSRYWAAVVVLELGVLAWIAWK